MSTKEEKIISSPRDQLPAAPVDDSTHWHVESLVFAVNDGSDAGCLHGTGGGKEVCEGEGEGGREGEKKGKKEGRKEGGREGGRERKKKG